MKNLILTTMLVAIFVTSAYTQYENERIGFAGITVPISIDKSTGFGMDLATIKNNPGIGLNISYIPETDIVETSWSSSEFFLLWEITDEFLIKTGGGMIQERERIRLNYSAISLGPVFLFEKFYIGVSGNLLIESGGKGLSPYSLSLTIGLKFE